MLNEYKIDESEISKLVIKEYTQTHFKKVNYPVLALSGNANQGNSKKLDSTNHLLILGALIIISLASDLMKAEMI